jgi:CRP-like cAMP-binding protein
MNFSNHIQLSHCSENLNASKQRIIYRTGLQAKGFYFVESGMVGLYQVSESGKESLLRIYGPGSYFGYRSLFTGQNYPSTARAMLDSQLVRFNIQDFKGLDRLDDELANFLMREVCVELGEAEKRLVQFNAFSAKKRILDTLHHFFQHYPNYPWTYREIGEYSGTDTTTVIRYCKKLKEEGILDASRRKPLPVNLEKLFVHRRSLITS